MGRRLVWDLETDGLRRQVTKVHLLIIRDIDTEEEWVFRNRNIKAELDALYLSQEPNDPHLIAPFAGWIEDGIKMLEEADLLVGHNLIDYDIPVIEKLYPGFAPKGLIRDTLILTRLIYSNVKEDDYALFRKGTLPGKLIGMHSLKAWGYRLGEQKIDFPNDQWEVWTPEMETYGRQDVVTNKVLFLYLERQIRRLKYSEEAIKLEHQFADLLSKTEDNGFPFNEVDAGDLYERLKARKALIETELLKQFRPQWKAKWQEGKNGKPARWKDAQIKHPKKTLNYADPLRASFTLGAPFCPVTLETFNPGSRDQIADRLQRMFGWVPEQFTPTGKPRVSEDILRDLVGSLDEEEDGVEETEEELYDKLVTSVPQAKNLADYFLVQKRIGQLAEGKNGWLKLVVDGKVHGSVNGLGAITRRVTHARPNMSQCPRITSPYGYEMRKLWHVPPGWLQFGVDLSGIEIRCFADVLSDFDEGEYAVIVIDGDVHTVNMNAFGITSRDQAKTILYALLLNKSLHGVIRVENYVNSVKPLTYQTRAIPSQAAHSPVKVSNKITTEPEVITSNYSTRRWIGKKHSCKQEAAAEHQRTHRRTKGGTISNKLQMCKKNARTKNLEFDLTNALLTALWTKQQGKCALSGAELGFIGSGWSAASVDRIDSDRGYVPDNVQWVCWRVNDAKSNMANVDFIAMCHAIAATSPYIQIND